MRKVRQLIGAKAIAIACANGREMRIQLSGRHSAMAGKERKGVINLVAALKEAGTFVKALTLADATATDDVITMNNAKIEHCQTASCGH